MDPPRIVLVPHTHWDREWYAPFEVFLERLVGMMDALIELLSTDPRFVHFHLDGQTAMIDDYLAVRPERALDIERLAREGRLSIGPWFTQMDEFLVSGESLIRNLEWGLDRGRQLGAQLRVGYLPDQFGHVGQMPQILRRAGIDRAVVWRGVPAAVDRTAFWWEAPDGSRVLAEYLAFGYSIGMQINACEHAEELATALIRSVELLAPYSLRDRLLVTVGSDHHVPAARLPALLEQVKAERGVRAEIGSIQGYLEGSEPVDVPTWRGELRSAARAHLLPNVYSNRAYQKQERARVEMLVERRVEPLAALVPGFEWPDDDLRAIWRLLLWNGAHDSVCGCSVDQVAAAVDGRHHDARALAQPILDAALRALAARMPRPGNMAFNPSPFPRHGIPGLGWAMDISLPPAAALVPGLGDRGGVHVRRFRIRLVDEGDVGDLYSFCPSPEAPPAEPLAMRVEPDGGVVADWPGLEARLRAQDGPVQGSVRLAVTIRNDRPDHRLRLHVGLDRPPTGSVALSPFEVVRRPLMGEGGTEAPSPTWPARGAAMAADVAVTSDGVFEYEAVSEPPELAITLLRCAGTISRPDIATRAWAAGPDIATPEGQMLGEHRLELGLWRGVDPERLPEAWERLHLPVDVVACPGGGDLPDRGSLLQVENALLSAVRKVDKHVEVRVWNPASGPRVARVAGRVVELGPARIQTVTLP